MVTIDDVNAAWMADQMPAAAIVATASPEPEAKTEILTEPERPRRIVEVARSFSYKMNLQHYGGPSYESVDLFCSQKTSCLEDEVDDASLALYAFCRREVLDSRAIVIENLKRGKIGTGK